MKAFKTICSLLICAGAAWTLSAQDADKTAFRQGVDAYLEANYEVALDYFALAAEESEGAALHYNLGNTYYKLNKIPESILHYERALKFEPANEDVRYNLRLANERIADRIERIPKSKFALWWEDTRYGMGPDGWAWIGVGLSMAATLLLVLFAFGKNPGWRRFGFFAGFLCVALLVATYVLSSSAESYRYGKVSGVIFADKVDVKSEPRPASSNVFVLHAGTKVELLGSEGDWAHIAIASGSKGWVPSDVLEEI